MDLNDILQWLPLLNVVVIPAAGWLVRALKRDMATKADLQLTGDRMTGFERRLDLVERDLSHLPDQADFASLKDQIALLSGDSKAQTQQLQGVAQSVARIEDWLMKRDK